MELWFSRSLKVWEAWDLREYIPVQVLSPENQDTKSRRTMPHLSKRQRKEFFLPLPFCYIQVLKGFSSVQFSRSVMSNSLWPHESQHARPPCPSPTPGVHSDSHPSSQWCHPAISSLVVPFSSCPQSLPASESFPMSQLFTWGTMLNVSYISVRLGERVKQFLKYLFY